MKGRYWICLILMLAVGIGIFRWHQNRQTTPSVKEVDFADRVGAYTIRIETPMARYRENETLQVKVIVQNNSPDAIVFYDTSIMQCSLSDMPAKLEYGTFEARPAYDLVYEGVIYSAEHGRRDYRWVWSEHSKEKVPTKLQLQSGERRVLVDTDFRPQLPDKMSSLITGHLIVEVFGHRLAAPSYYAFPEK